MERNGRVGMKSWREGEQQPRFFRNATSINQIRPLNQLQVNDGSVQFLIVFQPQRADLYDYCKYIVLSIGAFFVLVNISSQ